MGTHLHVASDSWVTQLNFWGFAQFGLPEGFRAQVLSSDFSSVLVDQTWDISQVSAVPTGFADTQFTAAFNNAEGFLLPAGDYWLALGAVAQSQFFDFSWVLGESTTPNHLAYSQGVSPNLSVANGSTHTLAYMLLGADVVPGPGVASVLLMTGLLRSRRRSDRQR